MSVLQDHILEVISGHKCYVKVGLILNGYGAMVRTDDLNGTEHDYRCTFSVTRYPHISQHMMGVPKRAVPRTMDWSWWSAELATAFIGPHSGFHI
jgi:hypothetical protein